MSILLALLLIGAQAQSSTAADRAGKFALKLPTEDTVTAPADPQPAAEPTPVPAAETAPATTEPPAVTSTGPSTTKITHFSLDTPIVDLIADPSAKAVLDKDMPGLSDDENLAKFQAMSLRRLAPMSGGQMTAELMGKLAYDLAALGGGAPPPRSQTRRALPSGR